MQPKKNPKADLAKSSGLFFAIGFALVSALTLWGFETKVYDKSVQDNRTSDVDKALDENQENYTMETPPETPPPPPPPAPTAVEEVKVVGNDTKIEEQVIGITETTKNEQIAKVEEIKQTVVEEAPDVDVPFTIIEDKPMFEACKNVPKDQQMKCFQENLNKHVVKNFSYPQAAAEMGSQGKVFVNFRINTDGSITVLGVRGPDKILEDDAKKLIMKLPRLIPGKQRGKPTPVTFAYPINYKLQNN